jgi:hypothetical protein
VTVAIPASTVDRNRLTTFFRFFLSIPHMLLVGGPIAIAISTDWSTESGTNWSYGSGGVLGAVACVVSVISWFAIMFTRKHPDGLWKLSAFYLRWRVRAVAYMTLLRDEYPPFGDIAYPAQLEIVQPEGERDLLSVALRIIFALPHIFLLALLSLAWAFTTAIAWVMILITGEYPESLYGFAIGVFAWSVRVEAYLLLLVDEYPPFTLRA